MTECSRLFRRVVVVIVLPTVLTLAQAATAQILPKAPPAPAPTPAYVPAPTPPPVPTKPPEPEVAAPDIVKRDATGKFIPIAGSIEAAAVAALALEPDRRQRVEASIRARDAELEKFVVDNLPKVAEADRARADLNDVTDFGQLTRGKEAATPLKQDKLLDRLQRDGAISAVHRTALDRSLAQYAEARQRDWETVTGTNVMKIATLVGQQGFRDITGDVFTALDRLTTRAAPALLSGSHGLTLDKPQEDALAKLKPSLQKPNFADEASTVESLRAFVLSTLTPEQAAQLLRPLVTPTSK